MRGAQRSAGTGGRGGQDWGAGQPPAPSRSPRRVCGGHPPGVSCPCGQTAPAHPAWQQLPRLPPPRVPAGARALPLLPVLCFLPVPLKRRRRKRNFKKKGKQLLRDDSELFAKVPFIVTQGGRPSPPRRKDFQRVLGPCLAASLSRVPHLTRTLPRGDVPLPRGHRPPGGPSPRPPMLVVRGLESRMGPLGVWVSCGGVWVGRGPRPPGLDRMPWVAGAQ